MYIELYQDHLTWWWRVVDAAYGRVICRGSETFTTRDEAEAAADRLVSELRGELQVFVRVVGEAEPTILAEYQAQGAKEEDTD